jgi:16S rRNA (cytosine1407-C5)-methyltransferase
MSQKPSTRKLPSRFAEFYHSVLGEETDRQMQAILTGQSPKVARAVFSRFDIGQLLSLVKEISITLSSSAQETPKPFFDDAVIVSQELASLLSRTRAFDEGKFYLQSIPSYLAIKLLDIDSFEYALDMCASPGGKAIHLYDRFQRAKPVIVNEPAGSRRMRLTSVLKTYGAEELPLLGIDGGLVSQCVINEIPFILLDAPCSGEAHIVCEPQRRKEWTPKQTHALAQRQLALACSAIHALKPGGHLLYSTCALSPFENELLICELLERFPDSISLCEIPNISAIHDEFPLANLSPLPKIENTVVPSDILHFGLRFRPSDFGEPFFTVLLEKKYPTQPKKPIQPTPIIYEKASKTSTTRTVKIGKGRRQYNVPAEWTILPPLPYLHVG